MIYRTCNKLRSLILGNLIRFLSLFMDNKSREESKLEVEKMP